MSGEGASREFFEISTGGFGDGFEVVLRPGTCTYLRRNFRDDREETLEVEMSTEQWDEFVRFLARIRFSSWDPEYESDEATLDGTSWEVSAVVGGDRVVSSGTNEFPEGWDRLTRWVRRVFGGAAFY